MAKIVSFKTACQLSRKFRKEGKKVIFTSGCFDILHVGHIRFLQKAKKYGGRNSLLFVGVDPDKYLILNKGPDRPIYSQKIRAEIMASILGVDFVVILKDAARAAKLFANSRYKRLLPSVIVFGNTEKLILDKIQQEAWQAGCEFKHLPHRTRLESSSRIAKLILDNFPS